MYNTKRSVKGDSSFLSFEYLIASTSQSSTLDLLTLMGSADPDHRFTQVSGDLSQYLRVVIVGYSLDDSSRTFGRVTR